MRKRLTMVVAAAALALAVAAPATAAEKSCWGQLAAAFAQSATGTMGEHSSQQATPRVGLANLARALYEGGTIDAPTMTALGVYLDGTLGLGVDACQNGV